MAEISIIMPLYNGQRYLAEAIASVVAQTLHDWELVVVDDGSTDGSRPLVDQIAQRDERIRIFPTENGGPVIARNRGLSYTDPSSTFIIFLDQDDIWEHDALETLRSALQVHSEVVAAHGMVRFIDSEGQANKPGEGERFTLKRRAVQRGRSITLPLTAPTTYSVLVRGNVINTFGQVLIRRSAFADVGPLDLAAGPAADWELWLRLSTRSDIAFVPRVVLSYREHASSMSRDHGMVRNAMSIVRRKYATAPELTDELRSTARIGHRWWYWDLSRLRWQWAVGCITRRDWVSGAKQLRHAAVALTHFTIGFYAGNMKAQVSAWMRMPALSHRRIPVHHNV